MEKEKYKQFIDSFFSNDFLETYFLSKKIIHN